MKNYNVVIKKSYDTEFEIQAEDEIEAIEKAEMLFDDLTIHGYEMYLENTEVV